MAKELFSEGQMVEELHLTSLEPDADEAKCHVAGVDDGLIEYVIEIPVTDADGNYFGKIRLSDSAYLIDCTWTDLAQDAGLADLE